MNEEKIIRQFEENIDGVVYIITIYENGRVQKRRKPGYENAITDTEAKQLEMETNLQYLVDLAEINEEVS